MEKERSGNKFKRIVASGALVGGLVAGVGVDQVVSIPEASANQLPAEQFWVSKFSEIVTAANSYRPVSSDSPRIASFQKWQYHWFPKGTWLDSAQMVVISNDRTTELSVNYSIVASSKNSPVTSVNGVRSRSLELNIYYGKDLSIKDDPNTLSSYYTLDIANVLADGKYPHWLLSWYSVHIDGTKEQQYALKEGSVVTDPNQVLPSTKMSNISNLVTQAMGYIKYINEGYVLRPHGMYNTPNTASSYATVAYRFVPSK